MFLKAGNLTSLLKNVGKFTCNEQKALYSNTKGRLVISSKRKKLNFYSDQTYDKFTEIPLISKGWNHSKSVGDSFTVHGDIKEMDRPSIPLSELRVHKDLQAALEAQGITLGTKFQSKVIPVIKSGKHTLICAETGCGKTYAYLLPVIENLIGHHTDVMNSPQALILVPSRELAHQVGAVATSLCEKTDLKVEVVVGGNTKQIMLNPSFNDIDILVATPGALGKLSTMGIYKLQNVTKTILDEADSLLDDSFIDRLEMLLNRVARSQIILASATLPKKLPVCLEPIMESLVQIKSERLHKPLLNITQKFLRLSKSSRSTNLLQLASKNKDPFIIFSTRNETCNWVALFLRENGLKCANINGDMNYHIRVEQWKDFTDGYANILSATDVGSRGLDTTQVKHVINFDFPHYSADYIHRIGRAGRLGSSENSKVTNLITGHEEIQLFAIRTGAEIKYVDGNIKALVQKKIMKKMRESGAL